MAGGLIHEDSIKRIFDVTRRVEGEPLDLTRNNDRRRVQTSSSGDKYIGICKVLDVGSNTLNIVDGFSDNYTTETSAGGLQINKFNFDLPSSNFVITADSLIYIESILVFGSGTSLPATSATAEIKSTTDTTLVYEAEKEKTLISRVKYTAPVAPATVGAIAKFSQENVNPRIFVTNEC